MHELRCKTPELVRKEIWTHILAYNLIRTIMAQAAATHELLPRSISFNGTVQTLEAFQPVIEGARNSTRRLELYQHLLDAVASHEVADRPNRFEPRLQKRQGSNYDWLMMPRGEMKLLMAKCVVKI